jgi:hypothetical protein
LYSTNNTTDDFVGGVVPFISKQEIFNFAYYKAILRLPLGSHQQPMPGESVKGTALNLSIMGLSFSM